MIEYACRHVRSLAWTGDELVDFVGGLRVFLPDGTVTKPVFASYAYSFDRALAHGSHAVVHTVLGTKGVVIGPDREHREINRSYYYANAYEYPIALGRLVDGTDVLVHCPEEHDKLEIDDLATGRRLSPARQEVPDFFHSRLAISPGGRHVLSAGWFWSPFCSVMVYDVTDLDAPIVRGFDVCDAEVESAAFLDDDRILVTASTGQEVLGNDGDLLRPGEVGVWSISAGAWTVRAPLEERTGTAMPVGDDHFVGFYEHPRLFETRTGRIVERWDALESGTQVSCIDRGDRFPPLALDPVGRRFAVASPDSVTIVAL